MQTNSFSVIYGIYIHKAEQEEGFPAPPLRLSAATGPYQPRNFSVQRCLWLGKLRSCCASVRAGRQFAGALFLQSEKIHYFCLQEEAGCRRPLLNKPLKTAYTMNRICELFGIQYPIIQGGMVWCSGWRLAAAVSNAGGLGLIGAGSMHPDTLREHIRKCRAATTKPFGVNVPLMYPEIDRVMQILVEEEVKIVFTSAGNPKTWTSYLKERGITVAHVVSSSKFAGKCQEAGVDAIVAEGFEAGGHNGREETTTLCLIPSVRRATTLPLIAAGGIGTGEGILAAFALGAEGVQVGTRFALTQESSAHEAFKQLCLGLKEGDTKLLLKKLSPTRLVNSNFSRAVEEAEARGASVEELKELLGKGRAKKGIFEGNLEEGELEIGQVAALCHEMQTAEQVMQELVKGYRDARLQLPQNWE